MANGKVSSVKEILMNYALMLNNHTFLVNLMPTIIGSFDVIIGMYYLSSNHIKLLCFEKALRLPLPNREPLIVYGDKPDRNIRIISDIKARIYL